MQHDFDWNDLRGFLAVARIGRLTVAAKRIGIDHSTLSRRIAGLEEILRVKLFDRRSMGYTLTVAGELLLAEAEKMESVAIGIRGRIDDPRLGLAGSIRIGTPEGFGTYFLAPHISGLSTPHPELEIELVANPRVFSLSKREADIAVTMSRPEDGRLHARKLSDYELGLYTSRAYLKAHGPILHQWDLPLHPFVGYIEDLLASPELDYLSLVSNAVKPTLKISNIITQMTATLGGVGLGVLPCFMARREPELVRLMPDDIRIVRSYWLVVHSDMRDLARVKAATTFIVDLVRQNRTQFWEDTDKVRVKTVRSVE
jgi:DNA-binding transcriptional LysR family regulator